MSFEASKNESKMERVKNLGDEMVELAESEGEFRRDLAGADISSDAANSLADKYSDRVMERMELEKENKRLGRETRELRKEVDVDHLTKLLNRRGLIKEGLKLLSRMDRHGESFSVLFVDVDDFKKVNDSFGHGAGDRVLKKIAEIIRSEIRAEDAASRLSGEEFVVLLSNAKISDAAEIGERIRKSIENTDFKIPGKYRITVSAGIENSAKFSEMAKESNMKNSEILANILANADAAMYASKQSGKNTVTAYEESYKKEDDSFLDR